MKKILSVLLALSMLPTFAMAEDLAVDKASKEYTNPIADRLLAESATMDTSVFEGAPGYILQDRFSNPSSVEKLGLPSGWDVDKRGGTISGSENEKCDIFDTSDTELVSLSRDLLPHKSGKLTFETAFVMQNKAETGYSYTLSGAEKTAFKLATEGDKLAVLLPDGKTKQVATYLPDSIIKIKAILNLDTKKYELIINGKFIGEFAFAEIAEQIDRIVISTSKEQKMKVRIRYAYLYFGYAVNETFMQTDEGAVPYDWEKVGGGTMSAVTYDANQVYPDTYSFALYDPTTVDGINLSKKFEDKTNRIVFSTRFIITTKGDNSEISIGNGNQKAITVKTSKNNFVMGNGTVLRENYRENLWYTLKIVADIPAKKADVYLNYAKILEGVPFENNLSSLNTLRFETPIRNIMNMRIDDVLVYDDITPSDYVQKPEPVKPEGDLEIGMQMYSMWHDNHFGWDWVTAYPDRIPYLGTYAEGKPEVADWTIKWQTEHGFSYRTEIFSRAVVNKNEPIKLPTRYNAMYDGYFNAKYKDDIKFAVMWSGIKATTFGGLTDLKENIIPHFMENFFKQPNYLLKDNKPVLFMYDVPAFIEIMGGEEQAEAAISYWEEECRKEGFDGLMLIADGFSGTFAPRAVDFAQGNVYSYGWQHNARSTKTQLTQNDAYFATGANVVGSITMGYGRNPWSEKDLGEIFAEPQVIKETILGLKERFAKVENPTNMILLTCWDEYGEGHFFSPTRVHGLEYLNAVRDAVTNLGPKTSEELPTARAIARMDSLNLGSRRSLKLLKENDPPVYAEDLVDRDKLQVLAEWDFEKMGNIGGWKELKQVANVRHENGALVGEAIDKDPGVWIEGLNIPAADVQMIKITTKTEGAGKGMLFYQTSVDTDMGVNGKRFDVMQDSSDWKEYEGFPYNREKLEGNITAIRWDPQDAGFPTATDFAVKKIEILGYPEEPETVVAQPVKLTFNGDNLPITRPPFTKDGVMYFAIHRPLHEMKLFKTKYEHSKGTYTIEFDGNKTAVLTVGSNIMKLDGADIDLGAPCYYEDGNLFVPLRSTMEALGVSVTWIGETNTIALAKVDATDTYPYMAAPDTSKPFSWMFETRGIEGWRPDADIGTFKAYKGSLLMEISGVDPSFKSPEIMLTASDYKYLKLRIKNETNAENLIFFFISVGNKDWGGGKRYDINISNNDTEFKEYIIDLSACEHWKGNIIQFRVDPVNPTGFAAQGDYYIDSIEFLKELPQ